MDTAWLRIATRNKCTQGIDIYRKKAQTRDMTDTEGAKEMTQETCENCGAAVHKIQPFGRWMTVFYAHTKTGNSACASGKSWASVNGRTNIGQHYDVNEL